MAYIKDTEGWYQNNKYPRICSYVNICRKYSYFSDMNVKEMYFVHWSTFSFEVVP